MAGGSLDVERPWRDGRRGGGAHAGPGPRGGGRGRARRRQGGRTLRHAHTLGPRAAIRKGWVRGRPAGVCCLDQARPTGAARTGRPGLEARSCRDLSSLGAGVPSTAGVTATGSTTAWTNADALLYPTHDRTPASGRCAPSAGWQRGCPTTSSAAMRSGPGASGGRPAGWTWPPTPSHPRAPRAGRRWTRDRCSSSSREASGLRRSGWRTGRGSATPTPRSPPTGGSRRWPPASLRGWSRAAPSRRWWRRTAQRSSGTVEAGPDDWASEADVELRRTPEGWRIAEVTTRSDDRCALG